MTTDTRLPLAELTQIAIRVLVHEMGSVNTARFITQFTTGYGDYTQEKQRLFGQMTVDELVQAIEHWKHHPSAL